MQEGISKDIYINQGVLPFIFVFFNNTSSTIPENSPLKRQKEKS